MRTTLLLSLLLLVSTSGVARAQAYAAPDVFGIYFDMEATSVCTEVPSMGYYDAYIMLTNPTAEAGVGGIEFRLTTTVDGVYEVPPLTFSADGLSPLTAPDYAWGFSAPLPNTPIVHIATHSGVTFGNVIHYYVGPIESANPSVEDNVCYVNGADAGDKIPMEVSHPFAWGENAVAIHGYCPVPVAESTWGHVKSLYR